MAAHGIGAKHFSDVKRVIYCISVSSVNTFARYIYNTDSTRHRSEEEDTHHPSRLACCYEKANGMDVFCLRLGRVKVRKLHRSEFTLPSFGLVHANVSTFKDEIIFFLNSLPQDCHVSPAIPKWWELVGLVAILLPV